MARKTNNSMIVTVHQNGSIDASSLGIDDSTCIKDVKEAFSFELARMRDSLKCLNELATLVDNGDAKAKVNWNHVNEIERINKFLELSTKYWNSKVTGLLQASK